MTDLEKKRIEDFDALVKKYSNRITSELKEWLIENGFFAAPASTKYHGAYEGGLYDHSRGVTLRLVELTENNKLQWQKEDSPFIVGMFHDLCKIDQYVKAPGIKSDNPAFGIVQYDAGFHYEYNTKTVLKGHGTKSIMLLSQFMALTEEEVLCIRYHMGAYGNEEEQKVEWACLDEAIKKYSNVLFTHAADMLASKIDNT